MARIIENEEGKRRLIKMSSDDIISVVKEYQKTIRETKSYNEIRNQLENHVIFIPEDI